MTLALEIAATPLGWDDDRMSVLWNARADVTCLRAKLWISSVAAIGAWGRPGTDGSFPDIFDEWKLVNVPLVPSFQAATIWYMGSLNLAPLDEASLRALIQKPESDGLEFKEKVLPYSSIADYVVGIGNAGGGFLIMGVTNKPPRRIYGLAELSADALQKLRRSVYDSTSIRVELETVSTSEGFVLGVRIPPCPPGTVFHTREGKYLIRVGEDLVGLSADEVRTRLNESQPPADTADDLSISVRFMMLQHAQNYSLYVSNE